MCFVRVYAEAQNPSNIIQTTLMLFIAPVLFLTQTVAAAQKDINIMYLKWDKAVVAHDQKTMESILASSFVAKVKQSPKPMTKKDFISAITSGWKRADAPKEQSFTTKINKVTLANGKYLAKIDESVVFKMKGGKTQKVDFKSLDTWVKVGKVWQIVATEHLD